MESAKKSPAPALASCLAILMPLSAQAALPAPAPVAPRFSTNYMDPSVNPAADFYRFACGRWLDQNPVPADKSRWSGFDELQERNFHLVRVLLEEAAADTLAPARSPPRQIGDFFRAAMDTNRLEALGLSPLQPDLARIAAADSGAAGMQRVAGLHRRGVHLLFEPSVVPDPKDSAVSALYLWQGGLGLPDRDYYLSEGFRPQREQYQRHVASMLTLLGDTPEAAARAAEHVLTLETELAKASRTRTELRDDEKNYHKKRWNELLTLTPHLPWDAYVEALDIPQPSHVIVGQPEFLEALDRLAGETDREAWTAYLRWHLLRNTAAHLNAEAEDRNFAFYGTVLRGQPQPEPRWQRAARTLDGALGEALGRLYVDRHFPPVARERMNELVEDLKAVFRDRLQRVEWMEPATRRLALEKFERFTTKIGHPPTFRDYSAIEIRPDDHLGNVWRAAEFEMQRQLARIGRPVDRSEWGMTPQTVNAYFNPAYNEIVFPAGILQPPFFDFEMDDAVNYGAIGVVIGHEITHGYDDQGRKYDAEGNLRDWWTATDTREFEARARKLEEQFSRYEALPGQFVNGQLTLGENMADLGGLDIAFEALQRALQRHPDRRRTVEGLTPEQRFFLSLSQLWRVNWREPELRRRLVVDPHSPGQFRAIGSHVNSPAWYEAWSIPESSPLYRPPAERVKIW